MFLCCYAFLGHQYLRLPSCHSSLWRKQTSTTLESHRLRCGFLFCQCVMASFKQFFWMKELKTKDKAKDLQNLLLAELLVHLAISRKEQTIAKGLFYQ